jgi:hypothetical protein
MSQYDTSPQAEDIYNYGETPVAEEDMLRFEQTCERLNLILPRAFSKLMRDADLFHHCLAPNCYWFNFIAQPVSLMRVISTTQASSSNDEGGGINGYAFVFASCPG